MRTLGILIIILGIVLKIVKAVSPGVSWAFIIAGLILLFVSYLKKIRSS
jgi:glucose dehydrogenase